MTVSPVMRYIYKPHQPNFNNKITQIHTQPKSGSMALVTSPLPKSRISPILPLGGSIKPISNLILNRGGCNNSRSNQPYTRLTSRRVAPPVSALPREAAVPEPQNCGRIRLSNVVGERKMTLLRGREWNTLDIATAGVIFSTHFLSLFAPFQFNWSAFWVAFVLYVITGLLGITLSFHRNLSHRSFKLPKWLEYSFAYCGVQALQGTPIDWVSTHRYHHQFCDTERDPHSPIEGFWYSHMSWLFDKNSITERVKSGENDNVGDLKKQPFYRFIQSTYILHPIALGALLYALGGFPFLVWGMGVRVVWVYHITWMVNSVCHVWGNQAWKTGDLSRNNWLVAVLAFGEGWHNNHHAFEYSARHGLEWWQLDLTWFVVRLLQAAGLASEVKLPSEMQKQRMAFNH